MKSFIINARWRCAYPSYSVICRLDKAFMPPSDNVLLFCFI
ncbi:hypothetical protein D088_880080 [Salmonella enterica subsp. houtenae serovar 16:z4,z32:-- str. RKS3027]|nr:hypothetical protein D088_880080 [Salmonella enterica subsp. houtenae serovar 16:z4,z32:-- str. RKS3027]